MPPDLQINYRVYGSPKFKLPDTVNFISLIDKSLYRLLSDSQWDLMKQFSIESIDKSCVFGIETRLGDNLPHFSENLLFMFDSANAFLPLLFYPLQFLMGIPSKR